jgi:hypothetical protein
MTMGPPCEYSNLFLLGVCRVDAGIHPFLKLLSAMREFLADHCVRVLPYLGELTATARA